MIVLTVSIGIKKILNVAAKKLEHNVLIEIGKSFVFLLEFINVITPVLEKVSPNLDNGP